MSGMTREAFFEKWRDGPMDGSVNREMKSDLDAMLLAELRRAREEDCKAVCAHCADGLEVKSDEAGHWFHVNHRGQMCGECDADAIRRLSSKEPPHA